MSQFSIGDHASCNSEAGGVSGKIVRVQRADFDHNGHAPHASKDDPQSAIKSDKTDHVAAHKKDVLPKIK